MMNRKETAKRARVLVIAGCGCCILVLAVYLLGRLGLMVPCVFNMITGLMCPGCGNTRAALAMLRLDIPAALRYNILSPLEFSYILWVIFNCCKNYLKGYRFAYHPKYIWIDITVLVAVAVWGILRNLI